MDPSGSGQISNSKNNDKNKDNNINNNPSSSSQPPIFLPESSNLRSLNTTTSNEWVWTPYPPEPAMNLSWLNMNDEPFEYEYERFSDFDPRRDDHDKHIIVDQRQTSTEQQLPIHQVADNEGACASSKDDDDDDDQQINMRRKWKKSEEQADPAANYYYYPIYLTSSSYANASNKNVDDDDDDDEEEEEEEEEEEDEEEEQMVPPRHIRKLVYDLQNMYRYHGVEEDEQDGVLLENPFAYEKLRDDHMPYLKKFETVQKEREEAAAAAAAAAASSFGRRPNYHYSSSAPHPHPPYPHAHAQYPPYQQARERDPDYRPSSSRDSKRTVRIKRTINPEDPSQPPIISFQRNRKKPGCACSKSKCVKNLCGCVVLETGCNAKCRCTDCENPFGRKPGKVPKGRPPKLIIKRGTNMKE